jgi:RND family efflux transporter MFP subunit
MSLRVGRRLSLAAAGIGIVLSLAWLVTNQGPLAPTRVTVAKVERRALVASTFGIGTVEARRAFAVGPTSASRVLRVLVDQGDRVDAGQLVAELDPVDLNDRVASGELAVERAASAIRAAEAQLAEAQSRAKVANAGARRYAELRTQGFVSQEAVDAKSHEANAANAAVDAAAAQVTATRRDWERARAEAAGTAKLRAQTRLVSPAGGIVSARLVEPGTTVVAGQAIVQIIDPASLWVRARIDQGQSGAVRVGLPAEIVLRSDAGRSYRGEVQRVDWVSDAVTEERIVNVGFAARPEALSVGELVEVTIRVAELADARSLPAAAVKRVDRQDGVWQVSEGRVSFRPVKVGTTTLDGRSQILAGLDDGDAVVVHSEQALVPDAKVKVVASLVRP